MIVDGNKQFTFVNNDFVGTVSDPISANVAEANTCVFATGLNADILTETNFSVYPNPFTKVVYVDFDKTMSHVDIAVYDLLGKIVYSKSANNVSNIVIDGYLWENISSGVYMVRISGDNRVEEIKLIKSAK